MNFNLKRGLPLFQETGKNLLMNATVELALTDNNTGESLGGCEVSVMLPVDSMEDVPADVLFMNFAAALSNTALRGL